MNGHDEQDPRYIKVPGSERPEGSVPKNTATLLVHDAISTVIEVAETLEIVCTPEERRGAEKARRQILNAQKQAELVVLSSFGRR